MNNANQTRVENNANRTLIEQTATFVRKKLENAEAGHDWWHIQRVWQNTRLLLATEAAAAAKTEEEAVAETAAAKAEAVAETVTAADPLTCELAALLHDIADSKFHGGDEHIGPEIAGAFLSSIQVEPTVIEHVQAIILHMSFKASLGSGGSDSAGSGNAAEKPVFRSPELELVQDADRLDAIGAIGIARAFHYGGYKNRELYNPSILPSAGQSREEYKNSTAPTINHFYEKLLLLKDLMNTPAAKKIAEQRHRYMEGFLKQFMIEWDGPQPGETEEIQALAPQIGPTS